MAAEEIDEYLDGVPDPQRATLAQLRADIEEMLPEAEAGLGYGVPAYRVAGKLVAGFGASKDHCSYYPMSGSLLPLMAGELHDYEWSKGALHFDVATPLPADLLAQIIALRLDQIKP